MSGPIGPKIPDFPPEPTGAPAKIGDETGKVTESTTDKVTRLLHSLGKGSANPPVVKAKRPDPLSAPPDMSKISRLTELHIKNPPQDVDVSKAETLEDLNLQNPPDDTKK